VLTSTWKDGWRPSYGPAGIRAREIEGEGRWGEIVEREEREGGERERVRERE
jgi:hypothetical protein